jgi:predicted ATPase
VTFAFTDIEGSTQRWDRDRAAMQAALRRHDELVHATIVAHKGHVFKTMGDAFCAAFARAEDAVAAMLAAQRALAAENFSTVDGLRIRAAIHTGTADERAGDYFGPAVNRVARLLGIAHGGQVLVSGVSAQLVQGALPPGASLRDLGEHRLRDLSRPEHVYQLLAPDLTADFPALRSFTSLANNLPRMLTSFVGREREIADITALIHAKHLVTLVGSGGVGKTRTSLQVAANLLDGWGDGVWLIELAPLSRGEYIPTTVAQAAGLTLPPLGDPLQSLARALKDKRTLLIFDNCEHLLEPAARVCSTLLHACPNLKILATSRQGLGIGGEETYRLSSLGVPNQNEIARMTAIEALQSAAVVLFVERARTVDKGFALDDDNAASVADICRRLDGIPLALELAAARVKSLSPRQLRDRLDERFRVLTGGSRDVLPRHQTLRALIDWSHDLLEERERMLFRRLGIFVNGFTLEGSTAVGSGDALDEIDAFDVLASLVDKSLVLAEPDGDSLRYRLPESTRVYALEKLEAAGEGEVLASRHVRYLLRRFAELGERHDLTGRQTARVEALETELEDVRFALDEALGGSDATEGGELLAYIGTAWRALGIEAEGIDRCEKYLATLPSRHSRLLARLSGEVSYLLSDSGRKVRAIEAARNAVTFGRKSGDPVTLARALTHYADRNVLGGRLDEAEAALVEAEAMPEASESVRMRQSLLASRALLSQDRGDFEAAARAFEQLRKEQRSLGNAVNEVSTAINLSEIEHSRGQTKRAIAVLHETLPMARSGADKNRLAGMLRNLAGYLAAADDPAAAAAAAREAIRIYASSEPDHDHVAFSLEHLALVFSLRGDLERAATCAGYAGASIARHGYQRDFTETTTYDRLTALLREGLSPGELARRTAEGAALAPETAIALALDDP